MGANVADLGLNYVRLENEAGETHTMDEDFGNVLAADCHAVSG